VTFEGAQIGKRFQILDTVFTVAIFGAVNTPDKKTASGIGKPRDGAGQVSLVLNIKRKS